MALVIGLRSGKEKINSLCYANCCPFPQAQTILALFPAKQTIEKLMAVLVALQGSLKKEPPHPGARGYGKDAALSSLAVGVQRRVTGEGIPQRLARSRHPHWVGDTCLCSWKMELPQGQRGSRLSEWARNQETQARRPQVGKVGK